MLLKTMTDVNVESLKDVPHLGAVSIEHLKKQGITSKRLLYTELSEPGLMKVTGMSRAFADEAFQYVYNVLEEAKYISKKVKNAWEIYLEQKDEYFIPTGCKEFDLLFRNGVKGGYLTELHGQNGAGKTQVGIALIMSVLLEDEKNMVVFIDTEGKFKLERIVSILEARKIQDPQKYLERILIFKPNSSEMQEVDITNTSGMLDSKMLIKLIIIDSIISLYQGEYMDRGVLHDKFKKIKPMMRRLQMMADTYKIPILCINTVYKAPKPEFGRPNIIPAGGDSVGHPLAYRVFLEETGAPGVQGQKHRATMLKAPEYAENQALFRITDKGIEDVE